MSRPTVMEIVHELLKEDVIKKSGFGESSGGREPMLLDINENSVFSIGLDFEYPKVNIGILNFKCEPVITSSFSVSEGESPDEIIGEIIERIEKLIEEFPYKQEKIIGMGIGLPGIIDCDTGISEHIERIENWEYIPIKEIFESHFSIPVFIKNDVHLLASWEIESRTDLPEDFIYVSIRSGIGMAVVINDKVYTGMKGNAGFLGHLTVDVNGEKCVCGNRGCLETAAGQLALRKRYEKLMGSKLEDFEESKNYYDYLYQQTLEQNTIADKLLIDASVYLAHGIANVIKILEIPTIVLEGGLPILFGEKYSNLFIETLRGQLFRNMAQDIKILQSGSDYKMIVCACGNLVFEDYIKKNYSH
ncbi:ROK family protein [Lachnospiraceae bacterium ZAX-1]